jgi:hypothetical protein
MLTYAQDLSVRLRELRKLDLSGRLQEFKRGLSHTLYTHTQVLTLLALLVQKYRHGLSHTFYTHTQVLTLLALLVQKYRHGLSHTLYTHTQLLTSLACRCSLYLLYEYKIADTDT